MATPLRLVELQTLSERDWEQLIAGEHEPWGRQGAGLEWREKEIFVGLRGEGERLLAVAGAVVAGVQVGEGESFDVVGLGALIVTRSARGRGLMSQLVEPLLAIAGRLGPARAMIFCRPELVPVYRRLEFTEITAPVFADGPGGDRIEMPLRSMWRALHGPVEWPPGRVEVDGLPF
jgi:GNAT superfamily N-acetyltransferase